jgi:hypothetical protein
VEARPRYSGGVRATVRREALAAEVLRLEQEQVGLERDVQRIPYLGAAIVPALLAQWVFGPIVGFYAVLSVPALIGVATYLFRVRRRANADDLAEARAQLARMGGSPQPSTTRE